MTQRIRWFALLGVFFLAAMPGFAGDDVTLEGGFVWEREDGGREGDLKAIFTPTGDGEWSVAFHFEWEDGPHVYTGTCSGSLDGELSGDITSDGERQMKFKFSGSFEDGTFNGTHNFVTKEGDIKRAGTLRLGSSESWSFTLRMLAKRDGDRAVPFFCGVRSPIATFEPAFRWADRKM